MISPLAYVDASAKLGANVTVHPFAYIDKNVEIGDDCEIMPHVSIMSGTRMGKRNRIFNGAVIAAEPQDFNYKGDDTIVEIGDDNVIRENVVINRAIFGGNVLVSQGCRVGTWSMTQTGCRFRKDVPPYIVAALEPTTYYGVNSVILMHEGMSEKIVKHISHAYRIIYQGNASIFDALLMIKDQVPMSDEIQHIIDFISASKLGIIK